MDGIEHLMEQIAQGRGLWIGLFPTKRDVPIAAAGYRNIDAHLTLAHLGRHKTEHMEYAKAIAQTACEAAARISRATDVIDATLNGVARFVGGGREGNPIVLLLRGRELYKTHQTAVDALDSVKLRYDESFDFVPHVTMGRASAALEVKIPLVERMSIQFGSVAVVCGNYRQFYNLRAPVL